MEGWVKDLLGSEKKRGKPLGAKSLNGNYYLYHSTTKYDRMEKRARKVSDYIGRMKYKVLLRRIRSIELYMNLVIQSS